MKTNRITHKIVATAALLETHKATWPLSKIKQGDWARFDMSNNAFATGELEATNCDDGVESAELEAFKSMFDKSEYLDQLYSVALVGALKEENLQEFFVEDVLSLLDELHKCKEGFSEASREKMEDLTSCLANHQRHSI